jgi:hypothetical protein
VALLSIRSIALATALFAVTVAGVALAAANDVDGDGRSDTIQIIESTTGPSTLQVDLATGTRLTTPVGQGLPPTPDVRLVKNVDGRRGAEIFVDAEHISTNDTIAIFTLRSGQLHLAGQLFAFGGDDGIKFGFTCRVSSHKHLITAHRFLRGTNGKWKRTDKDYLWRKGTLRRTGRARYKTLSGTPPSRQTGIAC